MRRTVREAGVPSAWIMSAGITGINGLAPFAVAPLADWERIFEVNARGHTSACAKQRASSSTGRSQ